MTMTRPRIAKLAVLAVACGPAAGAALANGNGGTEYGEEPLVTTAGGIVAGVADSVAVRARSAVMLGRTLRLRGTVAPEHARQVVRLERFDYRAGRWIVATRARADANGVFLARWRTDHIGRFKIRAFVNQHARAQTAASSPYIRVTVFREVRATWYGPGFFGRRMACGGRLTHRTLGVAHPRLRCGTPVDLVYRGRRLTVPVVDRGPYANRASFDLTFATARALGFRHTDQIGAVSRRVRRR